MSIKILDEIEPIKYGQSIKWAKYLAERKEVAIEQQKEYESMKEHIVKEETQREKRRQTILKNFQIVKDSKEGSRRQAFALYRLWRYLDVSKESLAEFMRRSLPDSTWNSVPTLTDLFAEVFAEQCDKAQSCVFKPYLKDDNPAPMCTRKGCKNHVKWRLGKWTMFCSQECHCLSLGVAPWSTRSEADIEKMKKRERDILTGIREGRIRYQSDIRRWDEGKESAFGIIIRRMEKDGLLTRTPVIFEKHSTFLLRVVSS